MSTTPRTKETPAKSPRNTSDNSLAQSKNDNKVNEETLNFFYKPHTLTALAIFTLFILWAAIAKTEDTVTNSKRFVSVC